MNQSSRVIVNTLAQYTKTFLGIIIALFSTRVVLQQLGSEDFGLFSLVGSVLAFLSFFNTALTRSTQRFLSFYMGKNDEQYQRTVLYNSFILHIGISLFTSLVMLSIEPLLFGGFLNIAPEQIDLARILYRLMIVSVFFTMNSTPFNAVFVSHENIVFSSVVYIIGALLKLAAALVLVVFSNKLLFYGIFMCLISFIEYIIAIVGSALMYSETRTMFKNRVLDRKLLKSILSFSGYNLYGTLCIAGRDQGYAIVVNKFISLEANAGFGIANQVSGQVNSFVYSIASSMSPVITKSEGAGDRNKMIKYTVSASKISAIIYILIAIPLIYEMELVLRLWLGNVPSYACPFVICILIANLLDSFSIGFRTGVQAIGKIRNYFLVFYTLKFASIPASITMLMLGVDSTLVLVPYIVVELVGAFISIYYFAKETSTKVSYYIKNVVLKLLPVLVFSLSVATILLLIINNRIISVLSIAIFPTLVSIAMSYFFVLTREEKNVIYRFVDKILKK